MYNLNLTFQENRLVRKALKAENISSDLLVADTNDIYGANYTLSLEAMRALQKIISVYPLYAQQALNLRTMNLANHLINKLDLTNNVLVA